MFTFFDTWILFKSITDITAIGMIGRLTHDIRSPIPDNQLDSCDKWDRDNPNHYK